MNTNESLLSHRQDQPEFFKFVDIVDDPECPCGPDPMRDALWACNENGKLLADPQGPIYYFLCRHCGRIAISSTLQVIGRRDTSTIEQEIKDLY